MSLFWPEASNQVSAHEDIWFGGGCCLTNIKIAVKLLTILISFLF